MTRLAALAAVLAALFLSACQSGAPVTTSPAAKPAPVAPPSATTPPAAPGGYAAVPATTSPETHYVFGWGDLPASLAKPRGGSTRGASVTLAPGRALSLPEIAAAKDAFARDRAAILSLAGDYKVSFHFMESLSFAADYTPQRPYHSWATEHVRVIADTGRFISLQHTLVMFFKNADGTASEPMLTKHWRQDWAYEPAELYTFRGDSVWARRRITPTEAAGAWSQSVYQVDDSPRYAALGRWEHAGNLTVWTGERAFRPLPRREHTVRQDYHVMEGAHRIVVTPTGWFHEQNNWKRVAADSAAASPRYVAAEVGLDRYERITAPSLAAADAYWQKTGPYWASVRQAWADTFARHDRLLIRSELNGKKLYEDHFEYAEKLENGAAYDPVAGERHARETIAKFSTPAP
jgi:hypothetical protein